ncbi:MAG TPA: hypothetical protein DCS93_15925 [Microscillaceae bacterium]|nr:hypothetical protein [Microscillaceae bacterium]
MIISLKKISYYAGVHYFILIWVGFGMVSCQIKPLQLDAKQADPVLKTIVRHTQPVRAFPRQYLSHTKQNLTYLQTEQNLPDNFINVIFKDSKGYLWLGTSRRGVCRFDGVNFEVFTTLDGLVHDGVKVIFEDSKGNIWFGTYGGGVSCYDGNQFKNYTTKDGLARNYIYSIVEDKNHHIWFGSGNGATRYDGQKFVTYTEKEGLVNTSVRSICTDAKGNLWFGTLGGISYYDGEKFQNFTVKDGLISNFVKTMAIDQLGNVWVGTINGMSCFDGKKFQNYTTKDGLVGNDIWNLWIDKKGEVWVGTLKGLNHYDGQQFKSFKVEDGLTAGQIMSIEGDNANGVWLATYGSGICRYKAKSFRTLDLGKSFKEGNDIVHAIEEDQNGLLFGTLYNGVMRYNGTEIKKFKALSKKGNVHSIERDHNNTLWFATSKGLVQTAENGPKTYLQKDGLGHSFVLDVLEDSKQAKWISTIRGLSKFDGKQFKNFGTQDGLLTDYVLTTLEDTQGKLWIGTNNGLNYYDGKTFRDYRKKNPILKNAVRAIFEDSQKQIWIGTKKGVVLYNGKTYRAYTEREGLLNNEVNAFAEDSLGNIWMGTRNGVQLLHKVKEDAANFAVPLVFTQYLPFTFTTQDGFKGKLIPERSTKLDSKNRLWWGNAEGATYLDLSAFKIPNEAPKTPQMTHIRVQNQYIDFRQLRRDTAYQAALDFGSTLQNSYDQVTDWFNYPTSLSLPYDLNHLTFHFSAIDWAAPHKVKFRYRLRGLDKQWSAATHDNFADYRNIPYGKYTFEIQAVGVAQRWSRAFRYSFEIRAPWWHTWWARALYIGLGLVLVLGYVQWRLAKYKKRQKLLEQALIGPLIEGYRLVEQIGEGGFGRVYKAIQLRTEQSVAIKLLKDSKYSSQTQIDRFERETQLSAQISHPHIVKLLDKGNTEDGELYAAFEYIEGETLKDRIIRKGGLNGLETGLLMAQVLDALACAHDQGIVHRDLKPQNLMVTETGASMHIKVLDFGVGAFVENYRSEDYKSLTLTKETLGTPTYSAPEQLWGEPPTVKSDLYAWGLIVLECLTGTPVMGGSSLAEVFEKQINTREVALPEAVLEHPLGDILQRVLEKKVEKRVGSAARLYQECRAIDFNTLLVKKLSQPSYEGIDDTTQDNDLALVMGQVRQQQITVLCAQLDLHVPSDNRLDSEKLISIQKDQLNRCISIAQGNGGYLANSFGDTLTIYFGYPKAQEQEVQTAGRVALELLHHIQEQSKAMRTLYNVTLEIRLSVHTGDVLIKQNQEPEGLTLGIALNLLSQAKRNSVLVSDVSKAHLERIAQFEDSGSYTFSGSKSPMQVFSLVENYQ